MPRFSAFDAEPNLANGRIKLFMTLERGGIGRVVWGGADLCQYLIPNEGDDCAARGCVEGSYDGSVALDLGPDWVGENVSEIPVTFVVEGTIGLDEIEFDMNQSFRVVLAVESGLVILVDTADPALSATFNAIFTERSKSIAIRDATGLFGCDLAKSFCFNRVCDAGTNAGSACTTDLDCPEGTCVSRTLFSWRLSSWG